MSPEDISFVNAISARGITQDEHHNSIIREAVAYFIYGLRHRSSEVRQAACNAAIGRILDAINAEHEEKEQYLNTMIALMKEEYKALMKKKGKANQTEAGKEKDRTVVSISRRKNETGILEASDDTGGEEC